MTSRTVAENVPNISNKLFPFCHGHDSKKRLLLKQDNRPFPSCREPYYESEVKCKTFHMKISFVCI